MAAKSKHTDEQAIEAVDLIDMLTPPGCDGCYEGEISADDVFVDDCELHAADEKEISADNKSLNQLQKALGSKPSGPGQLHPTPPNMLPRLPVKESSPAPVVIETAEKAPIKPIKATANARLSPLPEIENDSLAAIADEITGCQKCDLCKTRNKTVPGVGPGKVKLVLIGEAPGADEDASGIPFVGKAGQHLDRILLAAGFKREELYICNILKCRPPENRNPTLSEMICCTPYLQRQLRLLNPQLIACLGNVAIKFVIGPDAPGITRIHGQWFTSIFDIPTMAMYHPSFLLRSADREKGSPNWEMWQDIQALKKRYDTLPGR